MFDVNPDNRHWPNKGTYIGTTDFEFGAVIGKKGTIFLREKEWNERRVYQDELDYFNGRSYRRRPVGNGQSWTIVIMKGILR